MTDCYRKDGIDLKTPFFEHLILAHAPDVITEIPFGGPENILTDVEMQGRIDGRSKLVLDLFIPKWVPGPIPCR